VSCIFKLGLINILYHYYELICQKNKVKSIASLIWPIKVLSPCVFITFFVYIGGWTKLFSEFMLAIIALWTNSLHWHTFLPLTSWNFGRISTPLRIIESILVWSDSTTLNYLHILQSIAIQYAVRAPFSPRTLLHVAALCCTLLHGTAWYRMLPHVTAHYLMLSHISPC
jgi:hypothetical protein